MPFRWRVSCRTTRADCFTDLLSALTGSGAQLVGVRTCSVRLQEYRSLRPELIRRELDRASLEDQLASVICAAAWFAMTAMLSTSCQVRADEEQLVEGLNSRDTQNQYCLRLLLLRLYKHVQAGAISSSPGPRRRSGPCARTLLPRTPRSHTSGAPSLEARQIRAVCCRVLDRLLFRLGIHLLALVVTRPLPVPG